MADNIISKINVNDTTYDIRDTSASHVVANPTLVGTEADLTGIEIDGVKYKAGSGGLYIHSLTINDDIRKMNIAFNLITNSATPLTESGIRGIITNKTIPCSGTSFDDALNNCYLIKYIKWDTTSSKYVLHYNIKLLPSVAESNGYLQFTTTILQTIVDSVTQIS